MSAAPYTRPLSPFERIWVAGHTSCSMMLIEGVGELALESVRRAVAHAASKNAGSQVVLRGIGPWAYWQAAPAATEVIEVDAGDWDGLSPSGAPFDALSHMDVRQAPSHSWVLLRGRPTRLILRAHHATMDGKGMMTLAADVFRALRGETLLGSNGTETDLGLARTLGGRARKIGKQALKPFPDSDSTEMGSTWQRLRINGPLKQHVLARTIFAIASAARQYHAGEVLIDIPVNLRAHFPEMRHIGNVTGSLRLTVSPDATVSSIAADIAIDVAEKRHADALISAAWIRFMPIALIGIMARRQAYQAIHRQQFMTSAVVSNLGYFSPADYSTREFKAHSALIIPPGYDGVPLFLCMSGHRDGLDLCARAPLALAKNGQLTALLEHIAAQLRDTISL